MCFIGSVRLSTSCALYLATDFVSVSYRAECLGRTARASEGEMVNCTKGMILKETVTLVNDLCEYRLEGVLKACQS